MRAKRGCKIQKGDWTIGKWLKRYFLKRTCRRKGENESKMPISKDNLKRYSKDWKLRSKFIRFYRAKGRCEWCNARHGYPHPVTGSKVVLTVAHIYDDRPEACSFLNLAALCQKCHNGYDAKNRQRRRKEKLYADQVLLFS